MIYFFTPYSFEKKLFEAWDNYMNLVQDPADWVCMMDGDVLFLISDFGHQMQTYIDKYPETGLFTCYASRCHYQFQVRRGTDVDSTDILYHHQQAVTIKRDLDGQVKEIDQRIAGHLILIRKSTWSRIRATVAQTAREKNILGVDTKISNAVLSAGLKIRLMRGIYIFHYLRLAEGISNTKHLT